jgi:hypothetical protein
MIGALFWGAREFAMPFVICLAVALAASGIFYRLRPHWGLGRISVAASMPLPALALLLGGFVFVRATSATPEHCGVDACGMAVAFSLILGIWSVIWSVVIFGLPAVICYGVLRAADRR